MPGDQPNTIAAKQYVEQRWKIPVGSYRASGSVAGSDHPKGLALDCMTTNLAIGNEIEAWALSCAWCKYTIWQRRYKEPGGVDDPYNGPSPHTDHVHISLHAGVPFTPGPAGGLAVNPAGFQQAGFTDALAAPFKLIAALFSFITNPGNWMRLGLFITGAVLVVAAIAKTVSSGRMDQISEIMDLGEAAE